MLPKCLVWSGKPVHKVPTLQHQQSPFSQQQTCEPEINGSPTPPPPPPRPTPIPIVLFIGFILFGIIFCECVFDNDLFENVIIDNLKNGFKCEFKNGNDCEYGELLNDQFHDDFHTRSFSILPVLIF